MEPRCIPIPAFHHIRARAMHISTSHRPEVGFASGRHVHVRSLGPDARDTVLLHGPVAADVGGHTVLSPPRGVRGGGDLDQEGGYGQVAVASVDLNADERRIRDGYRVLAVYAAVVEVPNLRQSVRRVCGVGSVCEGRSRVVLLALFWPVYEYSDHIHPKVMLVSYCFHMYFTLEIILATAAAVAQALFGLELEPQFDQPYLSTSVQNFWGRRWNLVVFRTLRSTVYELALCISAQVIGRKWASLPAVVCTFAVST
ncbi:hypothetical protein C3L33_15343, partial [Rhododendron williamsianum]